jgi:hypothetical protein
MLRIVSMIASATEIVDALGKLDSLVARSHECDYPERVAAPTHILTQIQCDVCAVSMRDVELALSRGLKTQPRPAFSNLRRGSSRGKKESIDGASSKSGRIRIDAIPGLMFDSARPRRKKA